MASLLLLPYAFLQRSVAQKLENAQELERRGKTNDALAAYKELGEYLGRFDWLKSHFVNEYGASQVAQLRLQYQTGAYDKVIDLSDAIGKDKVADMGAVYFWNGNALIQRGLAEQSAEDAFPFWHRAMAQYQKGLQEDNSSKHWNLRYNYELITTVIQEATKNNEEKPQQILRKKEEKIEKPQVRIAG
jgi:hypothetical protein